MQFHKTIRYIVALMLSFILLALPTTVVMAAANADDQGMISNNSQITSIIDCTLLLQGEGVRTFNGTGVFYKSGKHLKLKADSYCRIIELGQNSKKLKENLDLTEFVKLTEATNSIRISHAFP